MVTHSPSFDTIPSQRSPRGAAANRSRPRLGFLDDWGRDERVSIPMRHSKLPTWLAGVLGAALGIGAVALYTTGVIGGATLNETQLTATSEPAWSVNPEWDRATLAQAAALASTAEPASSTPTAATPPATVEDSASAAAPSASSVANAPPADEGRATSSEAMTESAPSDADAADTGDSDNPYSGSRSNALGTPSADNPY